MKKIQRKRMETGTVWKTALALLYPQRCPMCDAVLPFGETGACRECEKELPWVREPACMCCGKPVGKPETEFCPDCARGGHRFRQGRAAFAYTGRMRQSVYRMKAQNRRDYLDFYAESMARAGMPFLRRWKPDVIVPVPMHWTRRAERGYNQAELLAKRLSKRTGIPAKTGTLRCVRRSGHQKELGRRERARNLKGSFEACIVFERPCCVLLVDDVYTTGSTLDEAARALKAAGAGEIYFLVLCTGKGKNVCMTQNL